MDNPQRRPDDFFLGKVVDLVTRLLNAQMAGYVEYVCSQVVNEKPDQFVITLHRGKTFRKLAFRGLFILFTFRIIIISNFRKFSKEHKNSLRQFRCIQAGGGISIQVVK
jgi:hypothetical protein